MPTNGQNTCVTILIPVYERYGYLERSIAYIREAFDLEKVHFQVLDGSSPESAQKNEVLCAQAGISYRHYDSATVHFYQRMLDGITRVETPLVAILADDDLYNPEGFYAAVDFLRTHPDYSVAYGTNIHFELCPDQPRGFRCWAGDRHIVSAESNCPLQRLFDFFEHYHAIYYGVHRTDILRLAYQETVEGVDPDDHKFFEYLLASQEVVHGKVKQLDTFYLAREAGQSTSYARTTMGEQMFEPAFSSRYQRYQASLMKYVPSVIPKEKASYAIDLAFGLFIGSWLKPHRLRNRLRGLRLNQYYEQPSAVLASQPKPEPKGTSLQSEPARKDFRFYLGRLKQTMRHPRKLLSREFNYNGKAYRTVIHFLQLYLSKAKAVGV